MGQDDRRLRTPGRRGDVSIGKRHSCPSETEKPDVISPKRQSCPASDDVSTTPDMDTNDFDMQQIRMLERMDACRQLGTAPSYTNFKVTAPPTFSVEKYGTWRKELVFWREL